MKQSLSAQPKQSSLNRCQRQLYGLLRKKRVNIPLLTLIGLIVVLLFASPFIPQVQSTAQTITKEHPDLAKIAPAALRPPNLSIPTSGNWLIIPSASIKLPIVEGSSINVLINNVGVWHETGNINHNYVIAGHKLQYFRSVNQSLYHLNTLQVGDSGVIVDLGGVVHEYTVTTAEVVSPTDTAILDPSTKPELTIYTCNDFLNHARFVIIAQPVNS
jgi:LPXTG-site transpeptidase (sortase) family protein